MEPHGDSSASATSSPSSQARRGSRTGHGGARAGAGRRAGKLRKVPHRTRPGHRAAHPLHVTLRVRGHVWNLRSKRGLRALRKAFEGGCDRFGFRLVHYSVQGNHLHLIAEAPDRAALTRAMKGLGVRIARRLNAMMGTKGPMFRERYYARALTTPIQVRRALLYVLSNYRKHQAQVGERLPDDFLDPFSSARYFEGWRSTRGLARALASARDPCPDLPPGVLPARVPLLARGWRRYGQLELRDIPGRPAADQMRLWLEAGGTKRRVAGL